MKLASILSIAFIAIPTLAIPVKQYERSYNIADNNLYDREADQIVDHLTREDPNDNFGRELVDEIDERALIGAMRTAGKAVKGFKKMLGKRNELALDDLNDIFGRELVDAIDERALSGALRSASIVKGARKVLGKRNEPALEDLNDSFGRELADGVEERALPGSRMARKAIGGVKKMLGK